ncbi:MAG: oligosaccharide flippase family protein [Lachnospiraceae bacterium]|nr:oligosaccharide flippase family protein [Lachnospiraceae bacterium]
MKQDETRNMNSRKNSDFIRILSNTAWMVFDKVFLLALNLFVSVKIANYYNALGYGSYQYAVSVVAVIEIITTFIDGRIVKKKYMGCDPDVVVVTATVTRILLAAVSVLVGTVFLFVYAGDVQFSVIFFLLLLNMALGNLKFGMVNRFEYLLKSRKVVVASDLAALAAAVLQLFAVSFHWPLTSLAPIALTSTVISTVIVTRQYRAEFGGKGLKLMDWKLFRTMLQESFPLAVAFACGTIYNRCDSIMLGAMMTYAQVGIYSIAASLLNVVQIAISPIRESVYPKLLSLYDTDREEYARCYVRISSAMTWIYIVGVAFSFFILPYLFRFLNEEYAEAFPVYRVLVLGTFFMYNAALRAGHFTVIGKGKLLTYSQAVSVVVNIVLNLVGIRLWGMYGAALATVITQAVSLWFFNLFFEEGREVFRWQLKALDPLHIIGFLKMI